MKKIKFLTAIGLSLALIFTTMTGCRRVITYPDAVYSDIYSDVVISNDSASDSFGGDDGIYDSSENTATGDYVVDDPFYDDSVSDGVTDFGGIEIEGGRAFYVADYGAKGDGRTDDGIAINNAILAAKAYTDANAGKRAEVRFEKGRTYSVRSKDNSLSPGACTLVVYEAENITLAGENTTIQGVPDQGYLLVQKSSNIHIKGLNFTYDTPVAYTAECTAVSGAKAVFEVPEWYINCIRNNKPANESFAIRADGLRNHAYFTDPDALKIVDGTHCEIEFRANRPNVGDYMYLPTPGYSHIGIAFQVLHNTGKVTFENINIWNAAQFVFQVNSNTGEVDFLNVRLAPKDASSSATVAWRDVIHAKDNRKKLSFDRCVFKGTHDDVFNLSNTMCQVTEIGEDNEIKIVGLDYEYGEYAPIQVGDTVVAIDPYAGTYYGEAKVTEVIIQAAGNIRIRLDKDLGFYGGEFIYFKELACPGTTITNCEFEGTYRIKASTKIENCDFTVLSMWMSYSGQNSRVEGPVPENITFSGCRFKTPEALGRDSTVISFQCETVGGDPETEYHVNNIVFENCTFAYDNMIERTNPYVTIK